MLPVVGFTYYSVDYHYLFTYYVALNYVTADFAEGFTWSRGNHSRNTCLQSWQWNSHLLGLLHTLCHFVKLGYNVVPPVLSKISRPPAWHVPQRTDAYGLSSHPTDTLCISKVKPDGNKASRKRRRVIKGLLPTVYCPVKPANFAEQFLIHLKCVNSNAQILKLLPKTQHRTWSLQCQTLMW